MKKITVFYKDGTVDAYTFDNFSISDTCIFLETFVPKKLKIINISEVIESDITDVPKDEEYKYKYI